MTRAEVVENVISAGLLAVGIGGWLGLVAEETVLLVVVLGWWLIAFQESWWPVGAADLSREREAL